MVGVVGAGLPEASSQPLVTSFWATVAASTAEPVPSTFHTIGPIPHLLLHRATRQPVSFASSDSGTDSE